MRARATDAGRRVADSGYNRKFLVLIDESPECDRAVTFAAHRVKRTGGALVLLSVIDTQDFDQFIGVADAMRAGLKAVTDIGAKRGVTRITAGNYGGKLGQHHYHLKDLI